MTTQVTIRCTHNERKCTRTTAVTGATEQEQHNRAREQGWTPIFRRSAICPTCMSEIVNHTRRQGNV
jgi:hypothetical protein